jgi:hypothetical protein
MKRTTKIREKITDWMFNIFNVMPFIICMSFVLLMGATGLALHMKINKQVENFEATRKAYREANKMYKNEYSLYDAIVSDTVSFLNAVDKEKQKRIRDERK